MTSQYLQAKTRPGVARKPTSKCFSNSVFKIGAGHLTKLPNKQLFLNTVQYKRLKITRWNLVIVVHQLRRGQTEHQTEKADIVRVGKKICVYQAIR